MVNKIVYDIIEKIVNSEKFLSFFKNISKFKNFQLVLLETDNKFKFNWKIYECDFPIYWDKKLLYPVTYLFDDHKWGVMSKKQYMEDFGDIYESLLIEHEYNKECKKCYKKIPYNVKNYDFCECGKQQFVVEYEKLI